MVARISSVNARSLLGVIGITVHDSLNPGLFVHHMAYFSPPALLINRDGCAADNRRRVRSLPADSGSGRGRRDSGSRVSSIGIPERTQAVAKVSDLAILVLPRYMAALSPGVRY